MKNEALKDKWNWLREFFWHWRGLLCASMAVLIIFTGCVVEVKRPERVAKTVDVQWEKPEKQPDWLIVCYGSVGDSVKRVVRVDRWVEDLDACIFTFCDSLKEGKGEALFIAINVENDSIFPSKIAAVHYYEVVKYDSAGNAAKREEKY